MAGLGSRIILKSHYVKANHNTNGGTGRYAQYIGTREGVVSTFTDNSNNPATDKQKEMIDKITKEYEDSKNLFTYADYEENKTIGTASMFISDAFDKYGDKMTGIEGYVDYIANRPGSVEVHKNGLFSSDDKEIKIDDLKSGLKNYKGRVYMPIISLRAEDSHKYGLDNPQGWQRLINKHIDEFAKDYHIAPERMNWVAAYHHAVNAKGVEHNHIHMMIWSKDPKEGYQDKETGNNIRMCLARDIFRPELENIYEEKNKSRQELHDTALIMLDDAKNTPVNESSMLKSELLLLAKELKKSKGRKVYGYLPKNTKRMVDNIMDDYIAENPTFKKALNAWADAKNKQYKIYSENEYKLPPASQIPELKSIKNDIIKHAKDIEREVRYSSTQKNLPAEQQYKAKPMSFGKLIDKLSRDLSEQNKLSGKVQRSYEYDEKIAKQDQELGHTDILRNSGNTI